MAKAKAKPIYDVHPSVADIAGALTPVPGGIGPLTDLWVMRNAAVAARLNCSPVSLSAGVAIS